MNGLKVWVAGSQDPRVAANGVNSHTRLLVRALGRLEGLEVRRVGVLDGGPLALDLKVRAAGRLLDPGRRRLNEWQCKIELLARALEALPPPEVVHCQDVLAWQAVQVAYPAPPAAVVVHHANGSPPEEAARRYGLDPSSEAIRWFEDVTLRAYRQCDRLVAVSEASRPIAEALRGGPVTVIENGVELPDLEGVRPPRPPDLPPQAVVAVGQLVPRKGPDLLREAVRRLRGRGWRRPVVWLGDGPMRPALRAADRWRADEGAGVTWLGARQEVGPYLAHAAAFVLPSRQDNLPVALLEAMAWALPVVATAVGGVPDLVESGRTGLLVPPEDPEALAEALARLEEEPEGGRAWGREARRRVEARWSAARMAEAYAQTYRAVARPSSRATEAAPPPGPGRLREGGWRRYLGAGVTAAGLVSLAALHVQGHGGAVHLRRGHAFPVARRIHRLPRRDPT